MIPSFLRGGDIEREYRCLDRFPLQRFARTMDTTFAVAAKIRKKFPNPWLSVSPDLPKHLAFAVDRLVLSRPHHESSVDDAIATERSFGKVTKH